MHLTLVKTNAILQCECTGQLILRKISKIGDTRYELLRLKCAKFDFRWGSTAGEAYSAPQTVAVGAYFLGEAGERKGKVVEGEKKRVKDGRGKDGGRG